MGTWCCSGNNTIVVEKKNGSVPQPEQGSDVMGTPVKPELKSQTSYCNRNRSYSQEDAAVPGSRDDQRRQQIERKKALQASVKQLGGNRVSQSPSERAQLAIATSLIKMAPEYRKGPAEGSVLDHDDEIAEMKRMHEQLASREGLPEITELSAEWFSAALAGEAEDLRNEADSFAEHAFYDAESSPSLHVSPTKKQESGAAFPSESLPRAKRPIIPKGYPPKQASSAASPVDGTVAVQSADSSATATFNGADGAVSGGAAVVPDDAAPTLAIDEVKVEYANALPSTPAAAPLADLKTPAAADLKTPLAADSETPRSLPSLRRSLDSQNSMRNLLTPSKRMSRSIVSVETAQYAIAFVGNWKQSKCTGLEPYLKHLGVPWAKRKLAGAFNPELSFAVVDGVLQVLMPSPIGERLELLPINQEVIDVDPSGNEFVKMSAWDGPMLRTVAKDKAGKTADTTTTRVIRESDGALIQTNSNAGFSFERVFTRK
mmetsp:Transcript_13435/g.34431  ORF Transcript_13435/g.34431 Transcript_13435/m.34431 type:complete len:488 (+) Transcript_13435:79-1542(+)